MKLLSLLSLSVIALTASSMTLLPGDAKRYDCAYVETINVSYEQDRYQVIAMKRQPGNHVKAKYFAATDALGGSVYNRYARWSSNKSVILASSGTYMDESRTPVGLTIDNGTLVNQNLTDWDGLVIIYATGGIAVTNLRNDDLTVDAGGVATKYRIRNSSYDLQSFIEWAAQNRATVFQTHLLAYKNKLTIFSNSSTRTAERRFLAVGKNEEGELYHVIVQCPSDGLTLMAGAQKALRFLNNFQNLDVTFMINLDTGAQDVFKLYNCSGSENPMIKGKLALPGAANLLAYYYE